jgi:HD-GYP domain-containing protein (c-di-GMP phosphodiesterase class II)
MGASQPSAVPRESRLAELVAVLSLGSDLGMGRPMEHALRTCVLAVRLAEVAGFDRGTVRTTYYLALLRHAGCTADASESAAFLGDEIAARADFASIDSGDRRAVARWLGRHGGSGFSQPKRSIMVVMGIAAGRAPMVEAFRTHCEVAQRLAVRLGLGESVHAALGEAFERWDGRGFPLGIAGDRVCAPARLVSIARDAEVAAERGGAPAALELVRARSGGAYDPTLGAAFAECAPEALAELADTDAWELALAREPGPPRMVSGAAVDDACAAMADFADMKCPYTRGRSARVAELAEAAAWRLGMGAREVTKVRRAALVQDLGRVGVSNAVWDAPRPLRAAEWERVRLHPYLSERMLARCRVLSDLAPPAGAHHERLNGSGYHRGSAAADLGSTARLLAAADVVSALGEDRPHRPSRPSAAVAAAAAEQVRAGLLDAAAVQAVLAALGLREERVPGPRPAGLSEREAQVLVLLARGHSNRMVAARLGISPKTVGRHVEAIYAKARVSTRAAAALFASEHGLLRRDPPMG